MGCSKLSRYQLIWSLKCCYTSTGVIVLYAEVVGTDKLTHALAADVDMFAMDDEAEADNDDYTPYWWEM